MQLQILGYLAWLAIGASIVGCVYLWFACNAVAKFAHRGSPSAAIQPAVSVLKPLRGEDAALAENLRSFLRQDYPTFQLVFGTADAADPAAAVVRRIIAEFPDADIALVTDSRQRGTNLKVANLRNMLPAARHDVLVLADSDMRVGPDYLAAVTAALGAPDGVGLVTCLYRAISAGGFWSDLASLHINHGFLPQAVVGDSLGHGAGCFGATMALDRATLAAAGGFEALANMLADDHALGQAVRRLGRRVALSPYLVDDIVAENGFLGLFRHELRWARTIRLVAPAGFAGSIVTFPVPLALLALCLAAEPIPAAAMVLAALLMRGLTARRIDRALRLKPAPLWLLPIRDLLSFAVFVASFLGRSIAWRDRRFRIGPRGQLVIVPEKSR
ncbi:MAG TPA: bacteriohopanetetrol glucosamine biosynthesis glycosyltransferase HpnI [Stellaceae bacterium]|jgi:ceramide glucosyltransferase|nr:bacteriohopanetetrol glucosamine biosynthesis glycosyltransferase HpnI [Stellaceae bacterium]